METGLAQSGRGGQGRARRIRAPRPAFSVNSAPKLARRGPPRTKWPLTQPIRPARPPRGHDDREDAEKIHEGSAPRDAAGARGHDALPVRRNVGSPLPHPGLRLREHGAGRGPLQRRRRRASSIRASATRPSPCSSSAWRCWKARRPRAPPPAAWPPSPPRCWARSRRATMWSRPRRCSARAASSSKTCCRVYGVASTLVDGSDLDQWKAAMRPNTKTFFLESPTNPQLEIIDIRAVAEIAHGCGATLVVDNVFATPMLQSPLKLGADFVVYSATKHVDGQGRVPGRRAFWARRSSSRRTSTISCARPARPCRRSMPGSC